MSRLVEERRGKERLGWPDAVGDTLRLERVGGRPRLPEPPSLTVCPRATLNHLGGNPRLSDVTRGPDQCEFLSIL